MLLDVRHFSSYSSGDIRRTSFSITLPCRRISSLWNIFLVLFLLLSSVAFFVDTTIRRREAPEIFPISPYLPCLSFSSVYILAPTLLDLGPARNSKETLRPENYRKYRKRKKKYRKNERRSNFRFSIPHAQNPQSDMCFG